MHFEDEELILLEYNCGNWPFSKDARVEGYKKFKLKKLTEYK